MIMRAVSAADIEVPCAKMPAYTMQGGDFEVAKRLFTICTG